MKRVLAAAASVALGALALSACSSAPAAPANAGPVGITAHGVGTVTGTPDVVTIVLGVQTQAPTAKAALDANNQRADALITMLKGKGVAEADLRTSQLQINPSYNPGTGRISGYEVTNLVTATLHNLGSAGEVIDAAAEAAGDAVRVQQLTFSIDDDGELLARARADAVRQAQAQARQMADAAQVRLGALRSIAESSSTPPPMPYTRAMDASASSVPIQPGSQKLTVTVDVVYDIDQ